MTQLIVHDAVNKRRGADRHAVEQGENDEDIWMQLSTLVVGANEPVRVIAEKEEREEHGEHLRDAYLAPERMRAGHGVGVAPAARVRRMVDMTEDAQEADDDDDVRQKDQNGEIDEDLQFVADRTAQGLRRVADRVGEKRRDAAADGQNARDDKCDNDVGLDRHATE